jgi:hypothetical protein
VQTRQLYTAALSDFEGLGGRMNHELSVHETYVVPARPRVGSEGDTPILRFLERRGYLAERLAVEDGRAAFGR